MRVVLTDRLSSERLRPGDLPLLAPHLAGLRPEVADLVGLLPIGGANRSLLDVLPASPGPVHPWAAVLATDPFLGGAALWRELARRGVRGVANLPTTALVEGEFRRALAVAGFDQEREFAVLGQARGFGLEAVAVVFSFDQATRAREHGLDWLILHPGPPTADPALDRAIAEATEALAVRLAASGQRERLLVYRHPGFGALLDPALRYASGVLDWGLS